VLFPCSPAVLANGAGGAREVAAVALSKLPDFVWKVLPVRCVLICFSFQNLAAAFNKHQPKPGLAPQHLFCWPDCMSPPQLKIPSLHACSLAVRVKSCATHRVELPEHQQAPDLRRTGSGAPHTKNWYSFW
jgi:hypothetical protein